MPVYLILDTNAQIKHEKIDVSSIFGLNPLASNLFFSFETDFTPYRTIVTGKFPRTDLVTLNKSARNACLHSLEVKYFNSVGKTLDVEHYYRHPRSYKRRGVFSVDEPSPTVRGVNKPIPKTYKPHPGDSVLVSSNIRPLTTLERSYLQTFPDNFMFQGSKTDLEQLIGNAVPIKLAEYVARCLAQYIEDHDTKVSNEDDRVKQADNPFIQLSLTEV